MQEKPLNVLFVQDDQSVACWDKILSGLDGRRFRVQTTGGNYLPVGEIGPWQFDAVLLQNLKHLDTFSPLPTQLPNLPFLILADADAPEQIKKALHSGAQDFLPFAHTDTPRLAAAIQAAVLRHRALAPIGESEHRYHALFKNAKDAALITNTAGEFIDLNQAALELFGYRISEVVGLQAKHLFASPESYAEMGRLLAKHGTIEGLEVKLRHKNGAIMDCHLNITTRYALNGEPLEYHGIIRNVTTQKSLEDVWRRYEFIVNNSKEFMTLVNREYVYEAVNESYCHAHGKTRDEIVNRSVADVWGRETYQSLLKETFDRCFAGEESYFQGWLNFANLGKRYMQVTYYPYHNPQHLVTHVVVVSRDVTERKLAEEALLRAHAQTEQLLASIPSILIGVDAAGCVTHLNRPAETAFGLLADDVIGQSFAGSGISWDWPAMLARIEEVRSRQNPTTLSDVKYTRADGKDGFLNIAINPVPGTNADQAGYLLIGQDVTERKILESQLSQAQKLESIGQLAAGIAHEINTPTQYVGDNVRFLQDAFTDLSALLDGYQTLLDAAKTANLAPDTVTDIETLHDDADVEFLLEEIPAAITQSLEGIGRVTSIVRAMKEFSHPGVDHKTAIDVNQAIDSTITVARNEWKYVADIVTEFDPDLPPVPCMAGQFNQAILNMIINASHAIADATNGSQNGQRGIITVATQRRDQWAEIRITDTGTGIPEGVRDRIFDPFFTTKEVGHGTGQGLSIAHSVIVDKHGGAINFETETGHGTTFTILLPLEAESTNGVGHV